MQALTQKLDKSSIKIAALKQKGSNKNKEDNGGKYEPGSNTEDAFRLSHKKYLFSEDMTRDLFHPKTLLTSSHYMVYIKNHLFIVGIGSILNKDIKFNFDLIALIVCACIVRYQYYTIDFRYKTVMQRALFFGYKM